MAKIKNYSLDDVEQISLLGKALASPVRVEMLKLLYDDSLIIAEIAKKMNIPASSTAFHLKILEEAGLVRMEEQPGTRGATKLCSRKTDLLSINMARMKTDVAEICSEELPVGAFCDCRIFPTCGMYSSDGVIGMQDKEYSFYLPEKINARVIWSSAGYVEYRFANRIPEKRIVKRISLKMEICSEAPGYREDWKSDITVWVNEMDCGTWTCPGDFGSRRGRLTPPCCRDGDTQYGLLTTWEVDETGSYINGEKMADVCISDLHIMDESFVSVKIGNKPDATYVGGFNLFGRNFGDYDQGIILDMEYW